MSSEMKIEDAISLLEETLEKSYCAYSKFPVACVLIAECGKTFTGCNVENSSYGLSICAERTAAVKAVSEGCRKFKACYVMTRSQHLVSPCGACRQFLAEFGPKMSITMVGGNHNHETKSLCDILPFAFSQEELESGTI